MTRRPKKDTSITMHCASKHKNLLMKLAEHQRSGQGASEYVYENLVIPHLEQLELDAKVKGKIFGLIEI
ncbi:MULTISPECIES: hypothetical protein [Acinetobacter]|uniref:hypothetical protein n=1 Tax=Acinetobacter TaxID=469 RepID=UPI00067C46CA|nr:MULTISPECIES: hypothetical protein [Acinetobacter]KQF84651.1 hypothetical protein APC22_16750 [Acinetobacter pittii]OTR94013.1 hypothetical protein CAT26_17205 [Acinetobacter pittii]OTR98867.1 hypothetical protein CAT24_16345 [Acinetobacter pittii]WGO89914.1 hypothetical protein QFB56_06060 [Acinetobacter pittii]